MILAILAMTLLGAALGVVLGVAAQRFAVESNPLQETILQLLPGSQCGQCGYPGCSAAAEAVANGSAPVTLCPPGGRALAEQLAGMMGVSIDLGEVVEQEVRIAFVHEQLCIGCTKCLKRCPTDAILGGPKQIHTIFADACTGCEKCYSVCPTECIEMRPLKPTLQSWYWPKPLQLSEEL